MSMVWEEIIHTSNLAHVISALYASLLHSKVCLLDLNARQEIAFHIKAIQQISSLPELGTHPFHEQNIPPLSTAHYFGQSEEQADQVLAPKYTLLLLDVPAEILKKDAYSARPSEKELGEICQWHEAYHHVHSPLSFCSCMVLSGRVPPSFARPTTSAFPRSKHGPRTRRPRPCACNPSPIKPRSLHCLPHCPNPHPPLTHPGLQNLIPDCTPTTNPPKPNLSHRALLLGSLFIYCLSSLLDTTLFNEDGVANPNSSILLYSHPPKGGVLGRRTGAGGGGFGAGGSLSCVEGRRAIDPCVG
jgi:Nitrogen Permease regulator of amino acid transport activity 3